MSHSFLSSSAYPPGTSSISSRPRSDTSSPSYTLSTGLRAEDMSTIRQLHSEWFPLTYDEDFYASLSEGRVQTLVARNSSDEIVGLAVYRVRPLADLPGSEDFPPSLLPATYLMTLGVVQEWRGRGVAQHLLQQLVSSVTTKIFYLHVVEYNAAALALYAKVGFQEISRKLDFYLIHGRYYSAVTLARNHSNCINGFI